LSVLERPQERFADTAPLRDALQRDLSLRAIAREIGADGGAERAPFGTIGAAQAVASLCLNLVGEGVVDRAGTLASHHGVFLSERPGHGARRAEAVERERVGAREARPEPDQKHSGG